MAGRVEISPYGKRISLGAGVTVVTPWLSVEEAAAFVAMPRTTFVRWADRNEVPAHLESNQHRYHADDLTRAVRARAGNKD